MASRVHSCIQGGSSDVAEGRQLIYRVHWIVCAVDSVLHGVWFGGSHDVNNRPIGLLMVY